MAIEYITEALKLPNLIEPVTNPAVWYVQCETDVKASATAMMILNYVRHDQRKVGLLFTKSCDSKYHCAHEYAGAGEQLEKYTGGIAVVNVDWPLIIQMETLPLGVSMLHELGHAKQFFDRPSLFYMLALLAGGFYNESGEFESAHDNERAEVAKVATPRATTFNKNPKPGYTGDSAKKRGKEAIENENLALHEIPICKELKLKWREKY